MCTGCGVCGIICPKQAISIKKNQYGFFSPEKNKDICVECGLCEKVCYKFVRIKEKSDKFNIQNSKAYMAYTKDENIRHKSSSGGIGREISNYGILNKYIICGARYNYHSNRVEHILVQSQKHLDLITGSKYISSYTADAFTKLDKDKKYIVFGTPCQIYGLRKYMELYNLNNFVLVDFFCHGVPSYNLWTKYIDYIERKFKIKNISEVNFRDKTSGWHNYSMRICGDGKTYVKQNSKDLFLKFFLSNLCLRETCYDCKFRFNKIYSDIRIGDFWGPVCINDEKGSSIVLINTEKGNEVIKEIKEKMFIKSITFEDLKTSQYMPYISKPKKYDEFRNDLLSDKSIKELYIKYLFKREIKDQIILFPRKLIKKFNKNREVKTDANYLQS